MSKTYTMLLPAGDLLDNEEVTKATGTKKYTIHRKVVVEGHGEITANEGTVFMVATELGSNWINSVKADLLVKVELELFELRKLVNDEEDKYEDYD